MEHMAWHQPDTRLHLRETMRMASGSVDISAIRHDKRMQTGPPPARDSDRSWTSKKPLLSGHEVPSIKPIDIDSPILWSVVTSLGAAARLSRWLSNWPPPGWCPIESPSWSTTAEALGFWQLYLWFMVSIHLWAKLLEDTCQSFDGPLRSWKKLKFKLEFCLYFQRRPRG